MIQHVALEIPACELERCISFYRLLGFEKVVVPAAVAGRAVWLEHGGTQLHLMPAGESQAEHLPRSGHVAVVVPSYEQTVERLRAEGHPVEARREHWGSPRAYVRDPSGNLIELMARPPEKPAARLPETSARG